MRNIGKIAVATAVAAALLIACGTTLAQQNTDAASQPATLSAPSAASAAGLSASSKISAVASKTAPSPTPTPAVAGFAFPEFRASAFHADEAKGENGVLLDLSCTALGYVAVSATADSRLKFQVMLGDLTYTYDLAKDGTPAVYPLNCGSGTYEFRVMQNVGGSQYVPLYDTTAQVTLESEFAPFLRPSQMVNYSETSDCAVKVRELAQGCETDAEVVSAVYQYLTQNVAYDYDKASSVQKGYLPKPDETLATGKGICFDYAVLAASMLRTAGIPTRMLTGYVGDIYHAWNEVYIESEGWITVEIAVRPGEWQRIDTTFAASGAEASFLTNDANYVTRYIY